MNAKPITLMGINWFGLNVKTYSPHSLWVGTLDEHVKVLKDNGFNAVRLCMSAKLMMNLDTLAVNHPDPLNPAIHTSKEPDFEGKPAGLLLDALVKKLEVAGILVMFNLHRMGEVDDNEKDIGPLWYSDLWPETKVIDAWKAIALRYKNSPNVFAMDIKNEPHESVWGGPREKDFSSFCERVGDAIHAINPNVLIAVEGTTVKIWSDSVEGALTKPVKLTIPDKVIYTPHLYQYFSFNGNRPDSKENFKAYMDKCFGDVHKAGMTVVIGEWGYTDDADGTQGEDDRFAADKAWLPMVIDYLKDVKLENQFYWALNENAGSFQSILRKGTLMPKPDKIAKIQSITPNRSVIKFE